MGLLPWSYARMACIMSAISAGSMATLSSCKQRDVTQTSKQPQTYEPTARRAAVTSKAHVRRAVRPFRDSLTSQRARGAIVAGGSAWIKVQTVRTVCCRGPVLSGVVTQMCYTK